jgi:hypothetical protein
MSMVSGHCDAWCSVSEAFVTDDEVILVSAKGLIG